VAQYFTVHPVNPQPRLIRQAAAILRDGGVIAYPTDSSYALGCELDNAAAARRLRDIRGIGDDHHLTLVCRDLSEIGRYARIDTWQFRVLKLGTPGSFTFILRATREVPRRLQHPKRSTVGVRVPDHPVVQALLDELGAPILSSTLILPDEATGRTAARSRDVSSFHHAQPLNDPHEIREKLERSLDLIIDAGACSLEPTTVVDLGEDAPVVTRLGRGDPARLGIEVTTEE
jgi:tRNA threonylcarbamoyl adenosine modification protein (Sua5/YciO/YrdC/YwlC family)